MTKREQFKSTFPTINLKNGSKIYVKTDHATYHNVQGKSLKKFYLDESIQTFIGTALVAVKMAKISLKKNSYARALLRIKEAIRYINKTQRILNNNNKTEKK